MKIQENTRKNKLSQTLSRAAISAALDVSDVGDDVGDMSEIKLTERQRFILNKINNLPTITGKQLSETLSVSQRTIERDLASLKEKGILKRIGKDNDGLWKIHH